MKPADAWRSWDVAKVERAYSPSSCIGGNYQPFVAAYRAQSDAARAVLAGAHLAAMVAMRAAQTANPLQGTVLVSGIYDLAPLVGTSINHALGLDAATAVALSPARRLLNGCTKQVLTNTPTSVISYKHNLLLLFSELNVLVWGEMETAEFKRQSQDFAQTLLALGLPCDSFEVPGKNHFDIILDLTDPHTSLGSATLRLLHHALLPPAHPSNR
jgi:arylformamidase